jgi:multidrug efflux system outer membrane protein
MKASLQRCNLALAIVTTTAVLLAGCKLGPDYRRPGTKSPEAYRFDTGPNAGSFADQGWWQVYQDPHLQQLIREALANNLDVRIAAARIDQARAAFGAARLQQLPRISANALAERQRTSQFELFPGAPPNSNVFLLEGSLSYELDFWGKYRRASEAARAQLLQSDFAKQDVMAGLVVGVATAYFTLQALDEQLEITHRTVATRQKFVELTSAQYDRGTVSELDVATAQAQLAIAKANLHELQRRIGQAEDQLSVLLGHNPDAVVRTQLQTSELVAADVAPTSVPVPAAGLPSSLLERRPDLREAEQNLVTANAQVGIAKANLFPTITLTGTGGVESNALSSLFTGPARLWSVSGGLAQPLLDSQRNLYELDLADAQKRQALLQYQKSVQNAFQEVSDALIARQEYAEVLTQEQASVAAQRTANTIALARYQVGYASYFNVIDSDRDLFSAELSLSAARLNTMLAVVQLYRALGGGWQTEQATQDKTAPAAAAASATTGAAANTR